MYSTSTPRRTSSWCTRVAMVLLPEPESPVNQSTGAAVRGGDAAGLAGALTVR